MTENEISIRYRQSVSKDEEGLYHHWLLRYPAVQTRMNIGVYYLSAFLPEGMLLSSASVCQSVQPPVCPSVCLHHLVSMITPERFKLHTPYLHQVCIIVGARTLFIMGDLDLHLQCYDLDLQVHNTLLV